ncbi:hypothetical protein ACFFJY_02205 [Fictibacillus aquaticus]|uniref:Uncharacterized protein n=1 Tax=Fictibacillus aquaticus TaxID=2021314 RepID=A0A235F8C6_9BACL|nr:hypothetical protein [Fictibacillus aquaticus]OYD57518.1 hypothetical protein CGZ90_12660 [Fictibacillus aquaticus]
MGQVIPFPIPIPKVTLTKSESDEYYEIKDAIEMATDEEDIIHLQKRVRALLEKIEERQKKN